MFVLNFMVLQDFLNRKEIISMKTKTIKKQFLKISSLALPLGIMYFFMIDLYNNQQDYLVGIALPLFITYLCFFMTGILVGETLLLNKLCKELEEIGNNNCGH